MAGFFVSKAIWIASGVTIIALVLEISQSDLLLDNDTVTLFFLNVYKFQLRQSAIWGGKLKYDWLQAE